MKNCKIVFFCVFVLGSAKAMDENSFRHNDAAAEDGSIRQARRALCCASQPRDMLKDLDEAIGELMEHNIDEIPDNVLDDIDKRSSVFSPAQRVEMHDICTRKDYRALQSYINEVTINGVFYCNDTANTFLGFCLQQGEEELAKGLLDRGASPCDRFFTCTNNPLFPSKQWKVMTNLGFALFNRNISARLVEDLLVRVKPQDAYLLGNEGGKNPALLHLMNALGQDISRDKKEAIVNYLENTQYASRYEFVKRAMIMGTLSQKNAVRFLLLRGYFDKFEKPIAENSQDFLNNDSAVAPVFKDISDHYKGLTEITKLFNEVHLIQTLLSYAEEEDLFPKKQGKKKTCVIS